MVKHLPLTQETRVWSLGQEDPLEKVMATHCSTLSWKNPMNRGAWRPTVHGVTKSWTRLSDFTFTLGSLFWYLVQNLYTVVIGLTQHSLFCHFQKWHFVVNQNFLSIRILISLLMKDESNINIDLIFYVVCFIHFLDMFKFFNLIFPSWLLGRQNKKEKNLGKDGFLVVMVQVASQSFLKLFNRSMIY